MRPNGMFINKVIHLNSYSFVNGLNRICNINDNNSFGGVIYNDINNIDNNNDNVKGELETIFSEGILLGRGGPGTSTRKLSKCRTRKECAELDFLQEIERLMEEK